jgi:predicted GTPase
VTTISLSLVSHTNVGKTTLMRTLLREDVGEVADRPHVTEAAEAGVLAETHDGDLLRLWDTPGLGDSARLLKRLRASGNPIGWVLSQVWDRFTDRPLFSSQQALKNVRDEADVVLYLVNAAEDPASAAYVPIELEILGWIGRPVILLLNQAGPVRPREEERREEDAWRRALESFGEVRGALTLDAFARCWVQEDRLFAMLHNALPAEKLAALEALRAAWRSRNLQVFEASVEALAKELEAMLADREPLGAGDDSSRAVSALAKRAQVAAREATARLIAAHGLAGHAKDEIPRRVAEQFDVRRPADVAKSGLLGGLVSGLLGGLGADLAAGGASLGAGAIIGSILGALGAGGAAHAWNLVRGRDAARVRWSTELLQAHVAGAVLRYLAVAHFGRGRGEWRESEHPMHWRALAEEIAQSHRDVLEFLSGEQAPDARPLVREALAAALVRLYPEAADLIGIPP